MGRHSSGERRSRLAEPVEGEMTGTRADLRMLAHTRRLLVECVLAIVVILAVYFVVLAVIGRERDWLLLLIIPAGLGGVTVGALLDRAHRNHSAGDGGDSRAEEPEVAEQPDQAELSGGLEDESEPEA
jgi:hypothetical protein